jgi:hypothetical protein
MSGYVKLFSDIVESSIWDQDSDTCKVWITLLALSDADGYVRGSEGWLASKARVSEEKCRLALQSFHRPDDRSRTKDNDGKRIETLEDGWLILNYLAFRDRLSADARASSSRERVRRHRERYIALRNASSVTSSASASASVDDRIRGSVRERRTVTHFIKPTIEEIKLHGAKIGLPDYECEAFNNYYESNGWKVGKNPMKSWPHALANWKLKYQSNGPKQNQQPKVNQRNVGTYETTTDFAAAVAKRSVSSQMAEAKNGAQPPLKGLGNGI